MTYPDPSGSDYTMARGTTSSKNTTGDYGAASEDMARAHGLPDKWTQALLDKLNNGRPITTKTTE